MAGLNLSAPPANCPNEGICLTVTPRLDETDKTLARHDAALTRIGSNLEEVKFDLADIRITLRERDQIMGFIKTVFTAILFGLLVQIGTTVWWAGRLQSSVETLEKVALDHEARIRLDEKHVNAATAGKP